MKHGRTIAAAATGLVLVGSAALTGPTASAATNMNGAPLPAGTTPINILNLNDFHGRIDTDGKGTLGKNFACTLLTQRENLGAANTLTLGAGDLVGASPFTSAVQNDEPTIDYLNAIGVNASSVGNHEFDQGYADLTDRIEPHADFQYVGANVFLKGTQTPALKQYESYTVGGLRVAVIGGVTKDTPNLVAGEGVANLDFIDPVEGVNRVATQLTDGNAANGEADVLIAEYHEGGPFSSTNGTLADQLAVPVFAHLVNDTSAKVAAILQGHTHQAYVYDVQIPGESAGQTRPVLQTGNYAAAVGKIQLGYDPAAKKVTAYNAANIPAIAPSAACLANPTYQTAAKIIDDAIAYAAPIAAQPVGKITSSITRDGADDRKRESALSNLIAQQYVESLNAPGRDLGVDIGVMNPGGVRTDLLYGTDGTVTFAQAATVLPFGNNLKAADYTGAQFKQILEEQWQPDGLSRPYLALGVSKNVSYTYDPNRPKGDRITGIFLDGKPIDPAGTYTIASSSFLITNVGVAPDNFGTFLEGTNYRDSGLVDQNAFVDWIGANSPLSPPLVQHGVGVLAAKVTGDKNASQKFTLRLEGFDLAGASAVANTSAKVAINGVTIQDVPITTVRVPAPPSPSRDGVLDASFSLTKQQLLPWTKGNGHRDVPVMLTITAAPTGTTAYVPVTISK
ncbi:bifunctional metallophosphatase/5'-nucleotidase [Knoellia sp. Soil729]|uniref:bifunctional metallophosphatase/5'-nucleotidase n=1 Tax=Knoellia sp. Soil729 TaxID=1736394 RepID=UPI0006FC24A3|nr:bifunctional UDP-sugar hydrolase/5'-nucleotidase [Knoellia sp. Soil729]KRE40855.1 multifunctional 2',3'-cyclic-nucleotide 2'-phosphodiesterase/5'-nucleotidase/3'-nucleotidase [Knoellia sp. Soil729]